MRHDTVLDIPGKTNWLYEVLYNNAPHLHWGVNVVPWGDITHIGQKRKVCPNWSSYFFASILGFAGPPNTCAPLKQQCSQQASDVTAKHATAPALAPALAFRCIPTPHDRLHKASGIQL